MPNTRAAVKALRQSKRRHGRNVRLATELKTLTRKFERFMHDKQADGARAALHALFKRLDQARLKGVIHRNTVARKKSRLASRLARLSA
jgi:small subunit ribosomal protein S20